MFSRLSAVSARLATRNVRIVAISPRHFTQKTPMLESPIQTPVIASAATTSTAVGNSNDTGVIEGLSKIIGHYGWYPFLGLGATALVSKELFFLDTEFLLLMNFSGLTFVAYVMMNDSTEAWFKSQHQEAVAKIHDAANMKSEFIKANINIAERMIHAPEVVKDLQKEYGLASDALWKARNFAQRVEYHETVVKKLKDVAFRESEAVRIAREQLAESVGVKLFAELEGAPQNVKDKMMAEAIDAVGSTDSSSVKLPTAVNIFNDFVKKQQK